MMKENVLDCSRNMRNLSITITKALQVSSMHLKDIFHTNNFSSQRAHIAYDFPVLLRWTPGSKSEAIGRYKAGLITKA